MNSLKAVLWAALCSGLLGSCTNSQKGELSQNEINSIDVHWAVGDYLLVNGRPPKNKEDFVKFLEWRTDESKFYEIVLRMISDKSMDFSDADTLCEFTINDSHFSTTYKKKDGIYCNGAVCDSLEYLRKQVSLLKGSIVKSKLEFLGERSYYFKSPIWVNPTVDLIFKRENEDFSLIQVKDSLLYELYENFGNSVSNELLEMGCDSLVLKMYLPYFSEFEPPLPPI